MPYSPQHPVNPFPSFEDTQWEDVGGILERNRITGQMRPKRIAGGEEAITPAPKASLGDVAMEVAAGLPLRTAQMVAGAGAPIAAAAQTNPQNLLGDIAGQIKQHLRPQGAPETPPVPKTQIDLMAMPEGLSRQVEQGREHLAETATAAGLPPVLSAAVDQQQLSAALAASALMDPQATLGAGGLTKPFGRAMSPELLDQLALREESLRIGQEIPENLPAPQPSTAEAMSHAGSDVSPEALSRTAAGNRYYRISPGGEARPILADAGAVDVKLNPGEVKVLVTPGGSITPEGPLNAAQARTMESLRPAAPREVPAGPAVHELVAPSAGEEDDLLRSLGVERSAGPPESPAVGSPGERGSIDIRHPTRPSWWNQPAYDATYEVRHNFVTGQKIGEYEAGQTAERLRQAVPSRQLRDDMTAVHYGIGNPFIKGDSAAAATARVAALPNGQEVLADIEAFRAQTDQMHQTLQKLSQEVGKDNLGYIDSYMRTLYDPPKGLPAVRGSQFGMSGTTGMERARVFANPKEAIAAGWRPRTLDYATLRAETEKMFQYTKGVDELMLELRKLPNMPDGRPMLMWGEYAPKGYRQISGFPILEKAAQTPEAGWVMPEAKQMAEKLQGEAAAVDALHAKETFQPSLPGLEPQLPARFTPPGTPQTPGHLYVRDELYQNLIPVLHRADYTGLDKVLAFTKRANFLWSLFHGVSLTEAATKNLGLGRGLWEAGKRGFGVPGLSQLAEKAGTTFVEPAIAKEWISHGLTLEAPPADVMQGAFNRTLGNLSEWLRGKGGVGNVAAHVPEALGRTAEIYDKSLWTNFHTPMKATAAEVWWDKFNRFRQGEKNALGLFNRATTLPRSRQEILAMTDQEIKRDIARKVNNDFGGQNWGLLKNKLLSDPRAMRWMRRLFTSPDWNVSAVASSAAPLSKSPVIRQMGTNYWINALGLFGVYNMLNYSLSSDSQKGPHFMWENDPGHHMDLETGMHDEKGKKVYFAVGKHAKEAPELFWGRSHAGGAEFPGIGFVGRKLSPPIQTATSTFSGYSAGGYPTAVQKIKDQAEKESRIPGRGELTLGLAKDVAGTVVPFQLKDVHPMDILLGNDQGERGPAAKELARKFIFPWPQSKGLSLHDGQILMAEALRSNDSAKVSEISKVLVDNGYEVGAIRKAIARAKGAAHRYPTNPFPQYGQQEE
jgi:hypothetical protein